jgi:hypothetical protein
MKTGLLTLATILLGTWLQAAGTLPSLNWQPGSDWLNVKNFGAKGDGKTDDTAALQRAFDKLGNDVTVYLPAGRYVISDTLKWEGEKRLRGVAVIGHGRDTVLDWKGPEGGVMIRDGGLTLSRFVGFELEGNKRAATGISHFNNGHFETNIRNRFIATRNLTGTGICFEKGDGGATAEITFENCIFEACGTGVSFVSFNDYNYSFEGCLFSRNTYGIFAEHCNFYVRECRFESNRTDIHSRPEHMSSVRRSVSVGSGVFLDFGNSVSPMTVENCYVSDWTSKNGAIQSRGAPLIIFDCQFKGATAPINAMDGKQLLIISQNQVLDGQQLFVSQPKNLTVIPAGKRSGIKLNANVSFLKHDVGVPSRLFDAVRDFGAKANGRTDDTAAVRKTIAAAAAHGQDAIAYLPAGTYLIRDTLTISGQNYRFGGCGVGTKIKFVGDKHKNALDVRNADCIVLENFAFAHTVDGGNRIDRTAKALREQKLSAGYGADIAQFGNATGSAVTYYGVYAYGKYRQDATWYGLTFKNLTSADKVHLKFVEGNLRFLDSSAAEVFSNCSFEGTLTVQGQALGGKRGFFGFMTRLVTQSDSCLLVKDNNSIVLSDYYMEQCPRENIVLEGSAASPKGRVALGLAKIQKKAIIDHTLAIDVDGYRGTLGFLSGQFYREKRTMTFQVSDRSELEMDLLGCCFYSYPFEVKAAKGLKLNMVDCSFVGKADGIKGEQATCSVPSIADVAPLGALLDDFRRNGEYDLRFNYPAVYSTLR